MFYGTRCTHDYRQKFESREGLKTKLKFSFEILPSTILFIDITTFQYHFTIPLLSQTTNLKEMNKPTAIKTLS